MNLANFTAVFCSLPLMAFLPASVQANESLQLTLTAGGESNVPRGLDERHELDAGFVGAEGFAGKFWQLGLNDSLLLGAGLDARSYGELSGFNSVAATLSATYSHKFGFGAYAPSVDLQLQYRQQQGPGEARDFGRGAIRLELTKRFSPALRLGMGVETSDVRSGSLPEDPAVEAFGYDPDLAPPFELFDYRNDSVFLSADYTFTNQVMLSATLARVNGSTVASTDEPDLPTYKVSTAFYSDPALDDWFAYRLDSNSNHLSTAVSIPLGADTALDFMVDVVDITAPADKSYSNRLFTIGMTWGF